MYEYRGLTKGEVLRSSAAAIIRHKFGHEIYNFQPHKGRMYGFARPVRGTIEISRLGASPDDEYVSNVLVVWTAPHPRRGVVIVGWYDNARVYRAYQPPPSGASRRVNRSATMPPPTRVTLRS